MRILTDWRNKYWRRIANKHGYAVEIILDFVPYDLLEELEIIIPSIEVQEQIVALDKLKKRQIKIQKEYVNN